MSTVPEIRATRLAHCSEYAETRMHCLPRVRPPVRPGPLRLMGFALIELLTALLILSLLALISYRGLATVLDSREHVGRETHKWRDVAAFFARFERDLNLASPRPSRIGSGPTMSSAPGWLGQQGGAQGSRLEFNRFAAAEGVESERRIAYQLNENREIELLLWPGVDVAPTSRPSRYPVLSGVRRLEWRYLDRGLAWVTAWPVSGNDTAIPLAVELRVVLATGEEIVRTFATGS